MPDYALLPLAVLAGLNVLFPIYGRRPTVVWGLYWLLPANELNQQIINVFCIYNLTPPIVGQAIYNTVVEAQSHFGC